MKTFLPHFPLTSGYYEFDESWGNLGQRFQTDLIPMGALNIASGRLAIGDPLLGMTSGANRWLPIPPGSYSVLLTRLTCLDRPSMHLPAYLSLILDAEAVEGRRARQGGAADSDFPQVPASRLNLLVVDDEGKFIEAEDPEDEDGSILAKSGVVSFVDEDAFERRMPNPLEIEGGWFERFFDGQSRESWTKLLDDDDHIVAGVANLPLPGGPDDWDETPPTIALAQMMGPRLTHIYLEYDEDDDRRLSPIAVHIELGITDEPAP